MKKRPRRPYSVTMQKNYYRLDTPSLKSLLLEKVVYVCVQIVSLATRSSFENRHCWTDASFGPVDPCLQDAFTQFVNLQFVSYYLHFNENVHHCNFEVISGSTLIVRWVCRTRACRSVFKHLTTVSLHCILSTKCLK